MTAGRFLISQFIYQILIHLWAFAKNDENGPILL